MAIIWNITPGWQDCLAKAGLQTYEQALAFADGRLLSRKSHSRTWLYTDGRDLRLFVKQDSSTRLRTSLRSLLRFSRPVAATQKERLKMERLRALGFQLATVVAYGSRSRLGLPDTAVMITLPVPGRPIDAIWRDASLPDDRRRSARDAGLHVLKQLQDLGCDWGKDCKPEHIFLTDDNQASLIDVERMHFRRSPLARRDRERQTERFLSLLAP